MSDVLGLADVVFPSMLAGWALRYDNAKKIFYENEKENSRKIIMKNSIEEVEVNVGEKKIVKKRLFDRVRDLFRSRNNVQDNIEINLEEEIEREKELKRELNILAILEEEKMEILLKKIETNLKNSVFKSSLIGYGFGCLLCEIFQTGEGQPALLYIVPSMFISVFLSG